MSSQNQDERGISFSPSEEVDDWLSEEAARRGDSREEVCRGLVSAAHAVVSDEDLEPADRTDLAALQSELEANREEFTDLVEDVRSRVIQIKRETDRKAPVDHDHPEHPTQAELQALDEEITSLEATVERGFDNFETVLDPLLDETDDLARRSTVLAQAVVRLRERNENLTDRQRRRKEADRLQLAANRLGVQTAACEDCGSNVTVALLTGPECPHCASEFADVAERSSIFGSHRLLTGEKPALEGTVERVADSSTDDVFEAVEDDAENPKSNRNDSSRTTDGGGTDR